MKKPSKRLMFAYILYCLLILIVVIAAIAGGDYWYFDFYDGFWPIGTGFDIDYFSIEETIIYALLPVFIYWIWNKLDAKYE